MSVTCSVSEYEKDHLSAGDCAAKCSTAASATSVDSWDSGPSRADTIPTDTILTYDRVK